MRPETRLLLAAYAVVFAARFAYSRELLDALVFAVISLAWIALVGAFCLLVRDSVRRRGPF